MLCIFAALMLVSIVSGLPVHNIDTGTDYATISDAVGDTATLNGHTILIDSGLYVESVNVTKSLTLRGNDTGGGLPAVRWETGNYRALNVSANGVTIEDLRLQGLAGYMTGIQLKSGNGSTVRNVTFETCSLGVSADNSDAVLIAGNTFENCSQGMYLYRSKNAVISDNTLAWNRGIGIRAQGSSGLTFRDNILNGTGASTGIYNDDSSAVYTGNIVANFSRGIDIYGSTVYPATVYNNYFNNTYNARADSLSIWNVTPAPGTNIIGGSFIGGNFWSDYCGGDVDGDGIGDTNLPHASSNIATGGDRAPLTAPETVPDRVHNLETGRHYRAIQHAIDDPATLAGHTLAIDSGTYKEQVNVTKALTVVGRDTGGGLPVIVPGPMHGVTLFAGKSTVEGLQVESRERGSGTGFLVISSDNSLAGCTAQDCGIGIWLSRANNNTVSRCEATGVDFAGVYLQQSNNNTFTGNNVSYNSPSPGYALQYGFSLDQKSTNNTLIENTVGHNVFGVYIKGSSSNATLLRNTVTHNEVGIVLESSSGHTVEENVAMENTDEDISLYASGYNRIANNTLGSSGAGGSGITGGGSNNLIANNTIHSARGPGSPAYTFGIDLRGSGYSVLNNSVRGYYAGVRLAGSNQNVIGNEIADNEESGLEIIIADAGIFDPSPPQVWKFSEFNTIAENTVARNGNGISLPLSSHNVVRNNTVSENRGAGITIADIEHYFFDGPWFDDWGGVTWYYWDGPVTCTNNTVTGNTVEKNGEIGINLTTSSGHSIYNNRFANAQNAWSTGNNTWNATRTPGENIIGGTYLGGNSWSDYAGADLDGDTIGDTQVPHNGSGLILFGGDLLPLTKKTAEGIVASFTADPTSGPVPLTVQLNDTSTGSPTAWNWSFGDGGWFNTTDQAARNATHTYTSPGVYSVNLTVGNADGSSYLYRQDYITAAPAEQMLASITVAPASAALEVGETRQFAATGYDQNGAEMPVTVAWLCANETVGRIDNGLFTALAPGTALVSATNGTVTGSAVVTVTAPGSPETGSLVLTANVTGAAIYLDGTDTGFYTASDSVTVPEVPAGSHTVGVGNVTGYRAPPAQTVVIPAGGTADVTFAFEPLVLSAVLIAPGTVVLEPGGLQQFTATGYDQYGDETDCGGIVWSCTNESVGTVDAAGLFAAHGVGTATVTASADGIAGTAAVTVVPAEPVLSGITVSPAEITLAAGEAQRFTAFCRDQYGDPMIGVPVIWSVENESVGRIDGDGLFEALAEGTTAVTATSGGIAGTAAVTVVPAGPAPVDAVVVSPAAVTLDVGCTQQFTAACYDENGTHIPDARVTWTVSDESVGRIDGDGLFEALSGGTTTVTATAGGVAGTATVTVRPPPPALARVEVCPPCAALEVGCTRQFEAAGYDRFGNEVPDLEFAWSCSDPCVGSIDGCGRFTALAEGTTAVTASVDGVCGTASIAVRRPAPVLTCIEVCPANISLEVGGVQQFTATAYDQYGGETDCVEFAWSCSGPCVGSIDGCGLFTALAEGTATVTASAGCVQGAACVTVEAAPAMPFADFSANVTAGTAPLAVRFTDRSAGSPASYLWEFGDGGSSAERNPVHVYDTAGTYTVTLTVENGNGSDTRRRTGYITVAEPEGPANEPSGGSGSSHRSNGGGSSTATVRAGEGLKNGENITFDGFTGSAVTGVTLTASGDIERVMLAVEKARLPAGTEPPETPIYEYLEITLYWADPADIGGVTIEFAVPAAWFEENDLAPDGAVLLHYADGAWQPLPTEFLGEEKGYYRFRATSEGFSCFAVSAAPIAVQAPDAPTVEEVVVEAQETNAAPTTAPATPLLIAPALAPAVLLLLGMRRRH